MLKPIQSFCKNYIFSTNKTDKREASETVKNKRKSPDLEVATCAILLEIANIDGEFSKEEQDIIIGILKDKFSLTDSAVNELMELTREELSDSIDIWQFTNSINNQLSKEEKLDLIEVIWKVIYADSLLDKHENYFVHKLQNLLRISHSELIDAKLKAKGDR
ncbi:MAG: TerB family tellurite resistance protein [Nitrospirota bacterium]